MRIRRPIGGRPRINFNPNTINPIRPGMQPSQTGGGKPFGPPQTVPGPDGTPIRNPILNLINPIRPPINISSANSTPVGVRDGMGPLPNNFGPMQQPVGDPRTGAAFIPGNRMQEMMRGPQQAAPTQPVPAMKKGGIVRGGRAETKGTRPAKLY